MELGNHWFRSSLSNQLPEGTQEALADQRQYVMDAMEGFKESLLSEGVNRSYLNQIFQEMVTKTLTTKHSTNVEQGVK